VRHVYANAEYAAAAQRSLPRDSYPRHRSWFAHHGYGIIAVEGRRMTYVASGIVRVDKEEWPQRLRSIFLGIQEIVATYQPHEIAIEKSHAPQCRCRIETRPGTRRGAVRALLPELPVTEYAATQIKQAIVGKGTRRKIRCSTWCACCSSYPMCLRQIQPTR